MSPSNQTRLGSLTGKGQQIVSPQGFGQKPEDSVLDNKAVQCRHFILYLQQISITKAEASFCGS